MEEDYILTEKELLYIEDAVNHEINVIAYLSDSLNKLKDAILIEFFEREIVHHNKIKNNLVKILRDGSCDW